MINADPHWRVPPTDLRLRANEVHVWRALSNVSTGEIESLQSMLVDEELEQARRFYFEKDRRRWMMAHAILRMVLGRYLDIDPRELRFRTNTYGKPSLAYPHTGAHLHFNLSHSGDLVLYAFAYDRQVGVDVEYMRTGIEYTDLAASHFSAHERAALHALPEALQEEAFFLCWSRKEAYIKARGQGLSLPLDQFDVSLVPGGPASLLGSREDLQATKRWSLRALAPGERYAGALVAEGFDWQLCCWQW